MRWIVNENVSATVIRTLRDRGHDVLSVKESLRGTGDPHILAQAQANERVLEVLESSVDWTGHFAVVMSWFRVKWNPGSLGLAGARQ